MTNERLSPTSTFPEESYWIERTITVSPERVHKGGRKYNRRAGAFERRYGHFRSPTHTFGFGMKMPRLYISRAITTSLQRTMLGVV